MALDQATRRHIGEELYTAMREFRTIAPLTER